MGSIRNCWAGMELKMSKSERRAGDRSQMLCGKPFNNLRQAFDIPQGRSFLLFVLLFCVWSRVSLCSPGWTWAGDFLSQALKCWECQHTWKWRKQKAGLARSASYFVTNCSLLHHTMGAFSAPQHIVPQTFHRRLLSGFLVNVDYLSCDGICTMVTATWGETAHYWGESGQELKQARDQEARASAEAIERCCLLA